MACVVELRQRHRQIICCWPAADLLALHQLADEGQRELVEVRQLGKCLEESAIGVLREAVRKCLSNARGRPCVLFRGRFQHQAATGRLERRPLAAAVAFRRPRIVPRRDPRGWSCVPRAVAEPTGAVVVPVGRSAPPGGNDRAAIFARDGKRTRASARRRHQLVTDRRGAQVARREPVFGVVQTIDTLAESAIEPGVGHDAVLGSVRAGNEHSVTARSERVAGPVVRVCVPDALLHQPREPARAESIAEPRQHVAAKLVDRHLQDEPRWLGSLHGGHARAGRVTGQQWRFASWFLPAPAVCSRGAARIMTRDRSHAAYDAATLACLFSAHPPIEGLL